MKEEHLYNYIDIVERVLAYIYVRKIFLRYAEHQISYSPFFQGLEKDDGVNNIYQIGEEIVIDMFPKMSHDFSDIGTYVQSLWAAEVLLRLQIYSHLTFEAIFIYMPLDLIYQCFFVYHEMDFTHMEKRFDEERAKTSVLGFLLKRRKIKMSELSKKLSISYQTLVSLKNRRLDIKKTSFDTIYKLATYFNVRPETIAEIEVGR